MLTEGLWLSFGHSTEVWILSLSKNCITYLMLNANSRQFSLVTQPRFWPFFCCLVLPAFQDTYARKLSHRVISSSLKFSLHFFREPCRLLLCFLRLLSIFSSSCCPQLFYLCHLYLSPEMIKKYLNILNPREKRRQTKKTSPLLDERMTAHQACLR